MRLFSSSSSLPGSDIAKQQRRNGGGTGSERSRSANCSGSGRRPRSGWQLQRHAAAQAEQEARHLEQEARQRQQEARQRQL
jgi:hypothetical protein